jgi:TetR/AcrR family transcriptional regulator, transcriptional repressor of aconitase
MKDKTKQKKEQVLNAAFECFMQYGYTKTTFGDIAKKARVSRASLYLYFKNKDDLFIVMNKQFHDSYMSKSEEILKSNRSNREKLSRIIGVWIVDPYRDMKNTSYANDLLDGLVYISLQTEKRFRELFIKSITPLVGYDIAEIIVLALRGLIDDRPPVKTLQKRIDLLIEPLTYITPAV